MPTSVAIALAAAAASQYVGVTLALGYFAGAVAGALTATVLSAALVKRPEGLANDAAGRLATMRQPVTPWQIIYGQTRVGGAITFVEETNNDFGENNALHLVITLAGHSVEEIGDIYFNDEVVPLDGSQPNGGGGATGKYANNVVVEKSLGTEAGQPFPTLVSFTNGRWSDAHRQTGRAKIYVRMGWNTDLFPNGVPNITAVVKGRKVYDPRSGLTAWSANAALCVADYLTNRDFGLGAAYAKLDEPELIAAANVCDEAVALAAGGTESRYTVNGAFDANLSPREALPRLLTAMGPGNVRFIGGKWRIQPAVYRTPAVTLTQDDLRGAVHIMPRLSRRDLANGVKGIYVSPSNNWQPTDFPPATNATYLAEDQGERIWLEYDLPFTNSAPMAQRIAKIGLERVRQQMVVEWPGKLTCYRLQPGDTVMVTMDRYGWSAKVFEVVTARLVFEEQEGGVVVGCDLGLRETASAVYSWSAEETAVDPAPDTNLPDAINVGVPGTPTVSEELYETTGSAGVKTRAVVAWAASADHFVLSGGHYELEYKPISDVSWRRISPLTALTTKIEDIEPGVYQFRVRSVNVIGVHSAYSGTTTKEMIGLVEEPAGVTGFFVTVHEGRARCHLDLTTDLDVRQGGRVWIRWSPLTFGATWNDGSLIKEDGYPGDSIVCEGPLYPGTYMAKFQDSTGNFSRTEASFVVTEALLSGFTTLNTVTFHPAFDGTKSNVTVVDTALQLTGSMLWDSMVGNLDDQGYIDSLGGITTSGSCTFTTKQDLGAVQTVRLFPHVKTLGFDTGDLWDSRTTPIDDWGLVDGNPIEDAEVIPQVRATNDDPNGGSPTWGPWHNLEVADYTARGFEYRTLHTSANVTHNRKLLEFSVAAKQLT